MRRKPRPGVSVGGGWVIPQRSKISRTEFAFVLELSESTVAELDDQRPLGHEIDVHVAARLLAELAACGFTGSDDAVLFGQVISGRRAIERSGRVWQVLNGRALTGPVEARTTDPDGAVPFDLDKWRRCRDARRG